MSESADSLKAENKDDTPHSNSNIIQSLDKDQANTEETKTQIQHIYYEPEKLCDVQVNYKNTVFHLHMAILARDSVYFKNLLEEPGMNKSPLELPTLKDFRGEPIDAKDFKYFLDRIYAHGSIQYKEVMRFATNEYPIYSLIYLSHYFQAERLEKDLQAIVSAFVKGPDNIYSGIVWTLVLCCQGCKWSENEKELIEFIGENLKALQAHQCYTVYWPKLNPTVRQQVYLTMLLKNGSSVNDWRSAARESAETIVKNAILPSQEWEKIFKDSITEAILLAAIKQQKLLS